MYSKTYFKSGTYNRICDECGFVYKRDQLRKRWDGLIVCEKDWEVDPNKLFNTPIKPKGTIPAKEPNDDVMPDRVASDHEIDEDTIQ